MSMCQHLKRIGDNYGLSCQTCGAVLEGYGYGGFFGSNLTGNEHCLHGKTHGIRSALNGKNVCIVIGYANE